MRIPVVIMTSSDDEKDILSAYNLHVNCYVTKPVDLDQFIGALKSLAARAKSGTEAEAFKAAPLYSPRRSG